MARTSNIYVRVEPEVKEEAEQVLNQLGVPMSNAIGIFLRQVAFHKGLPFDVKLPREKPLEYASLSDEEFNAEIEKGLKDLELGKVSSADQVAERMKQDYNA